MPINVNVFDQESYASADAKCSQVVDSTEMSNSDTALSVNDCSKLTNAETSAALALLKIQFPEIYASVFGNGDENDHSQTANVGPPPGLGYHPPGGRRL